MKKVLILTVTAGNGHNSAAYSMKGRLENAGVEVKVVDLLKDCGKKIHAWIVDKGYNFVVSHMRSVYTYFFNYFLKSSHRNSSKCAAQQLLKSVNGKLLSIIYDFKPDVIYGTAFYCGIVLSNLKRCYKIPCKSVVCMLDYVVSPFWEAAKGVDYLTISHEEFADEFVSKGFDRNKLICTGIPVREKFGIEIDKSDARIRLGLKDIFTVLIVFGGGYCSGAVKIFKQLVKSFKEPLQIVVINGKNKKSEKMLDKFSLPKNIFFKNVGYSEEIDLYMSASDILIGKCGGLTTTESINKNLPLLASKKLPGQEYYNLKFLDIRNLAFVYSSNKNLVKIVKDVYHNPCLLEEVKTKLKLLNPDAENKIFDLIVSQNKADYSDIEKQIDCRKVNKCVNRARRASKI